MKIVKKISKKTIRTRILSHIANANEAWGLDMDKAKREETKAYALLKANQDIAQSMFKQGWLTLSDIKAIA